GIPSAAASGQALSLFKPVALHVGIKRRQLNGSAQGWKMHRSLAALGMTPSFGKEPSESRHRRFPRDANAASLLRILWSELILRNRCDRGEGGDAACRVSTPSSRL